MLGLRPTTITSRSKATRGSRLRKTLPPDSSLMGGMFLRVSDANDLEHRGMHSRSSGRQRADRPFIVPGQPHWLWFAPSSRTPAEALLASRLARRKCGSLRQCAYGWPEDAGSFFLVPDGVRGATSPPESALLAACLRERGSSGLRLFSDYRAKCPRTWRPRSTKCSTARAAGRLGSESCPSSHAESKGIAGRRRPRSSAQGVERAGHYHRLGSSADRPISVRRTRPRSNTKGGRATSKPETPGGRTCTSESASIRWRRS